MGHSQQLVQQSGFLLDWGLCKSEVLYPIKIKLIFHTDLDSAFKIKMSLIIALVEYILISLLLSKIISYFVQQSLDILNSK